MFGSDAASAAGLAERVGSDPPRAKSLLARIWRRAGSDPGVGSDAAPAAASAVATWTSSTVPRVDEEAAARREDRVRAARQPDAEEVAVDVGVAASSSRPCSSLRSSRSQPANARCAAWRSHAATTRTSTSRPRRTTVSSGAAPSDSASSSPSSITTTSGRRVAVAARCSTACASSSAAARMRRGRWRPRSSSSSSASGVRRGASRCSSAAPGPRRSDATIVASAVERPLRYGPGDEEVALRRDRRRPARARRRRGPSTAASGRSGRAAVERGDVASASARPAARGRSPWRARSALAASASAAACASPRGSSPASATWSSSPLGRKPRPGGSCAPRTTLERRRRARRTRPRRPCAARSSPARARERVRDGAAAVGGDREVHAERAAVGDEPRQRVDERAEVDALERGDEAGVAVEQDDDARQRRVRRRAVVLGEREDAARARRACFRALDRPPQQREAAARRAPRPRPRRRAPQCGSASSDARPRVAKSRP